MSTPKSPTDIPAIVEAQLECPQQNTMPSSPTSYTPSTPTSSSPSAASVWDVIDLTSDDETPSSSPSALSPSTKATAEATTVVPTTPTEDASRCYIKKLPDVVLKMIGEYTYADITVHHYKGRAGKVKKSQFSQINSALSATCKKFNTLFTPVMTSNIAFRFDSTESMMDCISSMTENTVKNVKKVLVVERPFCLTFEDQVMKKVGKKTVLKSEHTTYLYSIPDIFTLFPHLQCDILIYEGYIPGWEEPSPLHTNNNLSALASSGGWKHLYYVHATFYCKSHFLPLGSWLSYLYYSCGSKHRKPTIMDILPADTRVTKIAYTPFDISFASSAPKTTAEAAPSQKKEHHGALSVVRKRKSDEISTGEEGWGLNSEKIVRFKKAMDENKNNWLHIKKKGRFHSMK